MIEAGTYLAAAMATGGQITVQNVAPQHLSSVLDTLEKMGASLAVGERDITLTAPPRYRALTIKTGPYPAFPTDLHPQFATLFTIGGRATGKGSLVERVWQSRFRYTEELAKMGATCQIEGERVTFSPCNLSPATVRSPDLRGGAALLIAALATKGHTEITNAATIGRGYEHLENKLRSLGADIRVLG